MEGVDIDDLQLRSKGSPKHIIRQAHNYLESLVGRIRSALKHMIAGTVWETLYTLHLSVLLFNTVLFFVFL